MKKVLVADDNRDILWVTAFLLRKNGFDVLTAEKGEEILNKIEKYHPQLILLDIYLSGTDGRDICKKLKSNEATRSIPIIMFSAHANFNEVMQSTCADDFVSKPFDSFDLISRIQKQMSLHHN